LAPLALCSSLVTLTAPSNSLTSMVDLALPGLTGLTSLTLQQLHGSDANGVCGVRGYREAVLGALPMLRWLDGER
jgi:hypothetical protein